MQTDMVLRLAQVPGIIGIKEATANIERNTDLIRRAPRNFAIYSGDDATCLALILMGGHGVISVTANVAPRGVADMCKAALAGDFTRARQLNAQLLPLHTKLFVEPNPIPVKWALARMGRISGGIRLPMTPLSTSAEAVVLAAMKDSGLEF